MCRRARCASKTKKMHRHSLLLLPRGQGFRPRAHSNCQNRARWAWERKIDLGLRPVLPVAAIRSIPQLQPQVLSQRLRRSSSRSLEQQMREILQCATNRSAQPLRLSNSSCSCRRRAFRDHRPTLMIRRQGRLPSHCISPLLARRNWPRSPFSQKGSRQRGSLLPLNPRRQRLLLDALWRSSRPQLPCPR